MINQNAQKWVDALESGEFEQTQRMLHKVDDGYCCLGVACEVYQREVGGLIVGVAEAEVGGRVSYDEQDAYLPSKVREWLGLRTNRGAYDKGSTILTSLDKRNDDRATFAQIARIIKSEPRGLFWNT